MARSPSIPPRGTRGASAAPDAESSQPSPLLPEPSAPAPAPLSATADEISGVLLEVLRKLNTQVQDTPPLTGRALIAVRRYQRIAIDLTTLADPPPVDPPQNVASPSARTPAA